MTPEEFKKKMLEIKESKSTEDKHIEADYLMGEVLKELGYGDGVEIFREMDLWYA